MCLDVVIPPKKPKLSKKERRELQEAQRAAKAAGTRLPKPGSVQGDAEYDSKAHPSNPPLSRGSEGSSGIRLQYDDKKKVAKRSKNAVIQRTKAQKQVRPHISIYILSYFHGA